MKNKFPLRYPQDNDLTQISKDPAPLACVLLRSISQSVLVPDLTTLWDEMLGKGWINPAHGRVVLRAGRRWFSPVVEQTALSLMAYLRQKMPEMRPIYWDLRSELTASQLGLSEKYEFPNQTFFWRALGCCFQDGVPLSNAWLMPFSLITVAGVGPDDQLRHSSLLSAQTEMIHLPPVRSRAFKLECIYEAHRLLRSDVAIVCGHVSRHDDKKGVFWAASNSDIGLEAVVAQAAGLDSGNLPQLRYLQKHEIIDLKNIVIEGEIPKLRNYSKSFPVAFCFRISWRLWRKVISLLDDLRRFRKNFYRLSTAIRKRVAQKASK